MTSTKANFTENWLQALTLSISFAEARTIKPLLTDVDLISHAKNSAEQQAAAERVWQYACDKELQPLLQAIPINGETWQFHGSETFVFRKPAPSQATSFERWVELIGVAPGEFELVGISTGADWADLVRKEAVRLRKPISVAATSDASTQEQPCVAKWVDDGWSIRFKSAEWLEVRYDEAFFTKRCALNVLQEDLLASLVFAESKFIPKTVPAASLTTDSQWIESVERLRPLHESVLKGKQANFSGWTRKTWSAVWPVIYREQNRLTAPCDIQAIRAELAECFKNVPQLTVWLFAMAKLLCMAQLNRGLGMCGDFQRD